MKRSKFFIKDFGCKINQYDTQLLKQNMLIMGNISAELKDADIVLINTCSVTHRADRDSIKYARKIMKTYPGKELIAFGCSVRNLPEKFSEEGIKIIPHFKLLTDATAVVNHFQDHSRCFVKVQQGCRNSCTYCAVKELRNPRFSKPVDVVITEIGNLIKNYSEIVLCATDFYEYRNVLDNLVLKLRTFADGYRWRFSSFPAEMITEKLLEQLKKDSKFCRYFHIPLQSANDIILNKMKRRYTSGQVAVAVDKIKKILKTQGVSFDIMVGFPGETDRMFKDTLDFIEDHKPIRIHAFRYSDRKGTEAINYKNKISENIKKERMEKILEISGKIRHEHFNSAVGRIFKVALENGDRGYTSEYFPVRMKDITNNNCITGNPLKKVRITGHDNNTLFGVFCG